MARFEFVPEVTESSAETPLVVPEFTVFGTSEENELWRIEEARSTASQISTLFRPGMTKAELLIAQATMRSMVVGSLIGEYRLGHTHGRNID